MKNHRVKFIIIHELPEICKSGATHSDKIAVLFNFYKHLSLMQYCFKHSRRSKPKYEY